MTRRFASLALTLAALLVLAACRPSDEAPTPSATPTAPIEATPTAEVPPIEILPTLTPTPPPTPTPLPPAAANGLWVIDLARGRRTILIEGDEAVVSRLEAADSVISASITDQTGSTAIRFRRTGDQLEEYAHRGMITTSANGESRFYLDTTDLAAPELRLEYQGVEVPLEAIRPRDGVSFSPTGSRLLTVSERPGAVAGEIVRTFSVHTTEDGLLRMQFEHAAIEGSAPRAIWSPSGRYIADEGLDGLFIRDTITGRAWRLGAGGSPQWSPAEELVTVSDQGQVSIVAIPDLTRTDLIATNGPTVAFLDRTGELAIVTTYEDPETLGGPTTRAFDVASGLEVAVWPGMDTAAFADDGGGPVTRLENGIAAVFEAEAGCAGGFVAYHPALSADGRCLTGANPRWSPGAQLLVYARDREIVVLSISSDVERMVAEGTPPASGDSSPFIRWSPDGGWILIQWQQDSGAPTN